MRMLFCSCSQILLLLEEILQCQVTNIHKLRCSLRKWQPTPVFLPEEPQGQRILAHYSPYGCERLDMSEAT